MTTKYKPADTLRVSTDDPTLDPDLTISVNANEVYHFRFWLPLKLETGGVQGSVVAPAGSTLTWDYRAYNFGALVGQGKVAGSSIVPFGGASTLIEGTVTTGSVGGTLGLSWAQESSDPAESGIQQGATLIAEKMN